MKKPADSKSDNPEDPELDEFSKLQQQYDEASIEERERLRPDLIRAIRKIYPGLLEKFERAFRNGDYLKATGRQCMKRVLARADLSAGGKTNAEEDADCRSLSSSMSSSGRTLSRGNEGARVRTGDADPVHWAAGRPQPDEVEDLHARFMSDRQRRLGKTPKRDKPDVAHAKELACEIAKENSELSAHRDSGRNSEPLAAEGRRLSEA